MAAEPRWLDAREDRAWRVYRHAQEQLDSRLRRQLLQDSGLSEAEFRILAMLSEHPTGRVPAGELCSSMGWEKSRLSHLTRRMQEQGLVAREPNPTDARSSLIVLLALGRKTIEDAAPQHVQQVRRDFIDVFTPGELDLIGDLFERLLHHFAEEPDGALDEA